MILYSILIKTWQLKNKSIYTLQQTCFKNCPLHTYCEKNKKVLLLWLPLSRAHSGPWLFPERGNKTALKICMYITAAFHGNPRVDIQTTNQLWSTVEFNHSFASWKILYIKTVEVFKSGFFRNEWTQVLKFMKGKVIQS